MSRETTLTTTQSVHNRFDDQKDHLVIRVQLLTPFPKNYLVIRVQPLTPFPKDYLVIKVQPLTTLQKDYLKMEPVVTMQLATTMIGINVFSRPRRRYGLPSPWIRS